MKRALANDVPKRAESRGLKIATFSGSRGRSFPFSDKPVHDFFPLIRT
jgi:hypothetical protein